MKLIVCSRKFRLSYYSTECVLLFSFTFFIPPLSTTPPTATTLPYAPSNSHRRERYLLSRFVFKGLIAESHIQRAKFVIYIRRCIIDEDSRDRNMYSSSTTYQRECKISGLSVETYGMVTGVDLH